MTVMAERPTTHGTELGDFEEMLALLDELELRDGFKAEIIRGNIVVSPWSKGYYHRVMHLVCEQLRPHLPEGHQISSAPFLYVFPGTLAHSGRTSMRRMNGLSKRRATAWTARPCPSSPN